MDIVGPVEVESLGGSNYALVIIDEYSRWLTVYGMNSKSQSLNTFKKYLLDVQAMGNEYRVKSVMSEHRVKGVRSDNAGEFRSQEFQEFCKSKGIKQSFSGPYAPQQNGYSRKS
jgi:transposase InsO family protein